MSLSDADITLLRLRTEQRIAQYGNDVRALGWGTKGRESIRYAILCSQFDLSQSSVLDFGCGFGDFYRYCASQRIALEYCGVDISPSAVAIAKEKHPGGTFLVGNPLRDGLQHSYDFIVSSGTHNARLSDNRGYIEETFSLFSQFAKRGFALNFLSTAASFYEVGLWYTDPAFILSLAFSYSKSVIIRHDYMPFEFTVFVFMNNSFLPDECVFEPYRSLIVKDK